MKKGTVGYQKVAGAENLYLRTSRKGTRIYYARLHWRQDGKKCTGWQSLKTDKITTAKLRLKDVLAAHRRKVGNPGAIENRDLTIAQLFALLEKRIAENPDIKAATKSANVAALGRVRRAWPEKLRSKVRVLARLDLEEWVRRLKTLPLRLPPKNSLQQARPLAGRSVNQAIDQLHAAIALAVQMGLLDFNLADKLPRAKESSRKRLVLPSREQMETLLHEIRHPRNAWLLRALAEGVKGRTQMERARALNVPVTTLGYYERVMRSGEPQGNNKDSADLAEGLMVTGVRKNEAAGICWSDIDFVRNRMIVRGTKTSRSNRVVPMIPRARKLFVRLRAERPDETGDQRVFRRTDIQRAIDGACARAGIGRMTPHQFRHYFSTVCIESGVDYKTISEWLGHADGGVLVAQTYGHLRDEHSQVSAAKVVFC